MLCQKCRIEVIDPHVCGQTEIDSSEPPTDPEPREPKSGPSPKLKTAVENRIREKNSKNDRSNSSNGE